MRASHRRVVLGAAYTLAKLGLNLRTQRFGQVTSFNSATATSNAFGPLDQTFSPKWITDVSASYAIGRASVSVGADNVGVSWFVRSRVGEIRPRDAGTSRCRLPRALDLTNQLTA